jgi:hypothetical protein
MTMGRRTGYLTGLIINPDRSLGKANMVYPRNSFTDVDASWCNASKETLLMGVEPSSRTLRPSDREAFAMPIAWLPRSVTSAG